MANIFLFPRHLSLSLSPRKFRIRKRNLWSHPPIGFKEIWRGRGMISTAGDLIRGDFCPSTFRRTFESETLLYTRVLLTCGQLCTLLRAVLRAPARISLLRSGFDEAWVNEPFEVPYARASKGKEREREKEIKLSDVSSARDMRSHISEDDSRWATELNDRIISKQYAREIYGDQLAVKGLATLLIPIKSKQRYHASHAIKIFHYHMRFNGIGRYIEERERERGKQETLTK